MRWAAHDADGGPLTSTVDYSLDGGRHWKVVADRVSGHSVRVASRFLSASRDGRLRVRIGDGFNTTTVTSGQLLAQGMPPLVQIIGAPRRGHVRATATLFLQGSAFDDANRPLTGRRLRWYVGKRLIGRGGLVTASGLVAGKTTIRLVATDSLGCSSQAVVPLRVDPIIARYLVFEAPLRVSRNARSIRIVVASTVPATFTIAGRRFAVGPNPRALTVGIRPGRTVLRLACSLRSTAGVIRGAYVAVR